MVKFINEAEKNEELNPLEALSEARQKIIEAISYIEPHNTCKYLNIAITIINNAQSEIVYDKNS